MKLFLESLIPLLLMNQIAKLFADSPLTRHALEMSSSAVLVANFTGSVLYANDKVQQWFGYERSEITGRTLRGLLPEMRRRDQDAQWVRQMSHPESAIQKSTSKRRPQRIVCKDGSEVMVNVTLVHVQEQLEPLILANLDRVETQTPEHHCVESERLDAVAKMISGLAHESRNALQRAVACLDLLELDLENDVKQMDLTRKIRRSLSDLLENYDEVKRFAEPMVLHRTTARLLPICIEAFDESLTENHFAKHEISIAQRATVDDVASIDQKRLKHAFCQILDNAMHRRSSFARIVVDCAATKHRNQRALRVTIHDDGEGFSEESLRRAFEPFYTTKQHGTGLGLSLSRRIIQAHGGQIQVSNADDGGAIITIILPRNAG